MKLLSLMFLALMYEDPMVFVPTGIYAVKPLEAETSVATPIKPVAEPAPAPTVKLQVWTAGWCTYCPAAIVEATAAATELGIPIELIDYDKWESARVSSKIEAPPTVAIVVNGYSRERLKGGGKKDDLISRVRGWQVKHNEPTAPTPVNVAPPAPPETKVLTPSTQSSNVSISQPKVYMSNPVSEAGRYVSYGGRSYDMATWSRHCSMRNCQMCNYLDMMAANYRANLRAEVPSPQAPSPSDVLDEALAAMKLTPSDVVAELGSGDGTPAIRMVRETGCRVVGVEIDPAKVAESRKKVEEAGLSDKITIVEGDVLGFDPKQYGATAVYAYLDPLLLAQITPALSVGRVGVFPGHKPENLDTQLVGQCWVRYN